MIHHIGRLTAVVAVLPLVLAAGCASSDAKRAARAQLERAEAAYRQAQADPSVQTYAPLRLMDAEKALQAALQAKDSDDKAHLGYLAERRAQLASVMGATAKTEQSMQQLRQETADVLLQKRDRELTVARRETDVKTREAEQARRAAEARARDAEAGVFLPAVPQRYRETFVCLAQQQRARVLARTVVGDHDFTRQHALRADAVEHQRQCLRPVVGGDHQARACRGISHCLASEAGSASRPASRSSRYFSNT